MNEMIRLNNVNYRYSRTGFSLSDISLRFLSGEMTILTGHNGSGKTTLSKLMIGIFKPQAGKVLIDGIDIRKQPLAQNARRVGYLFQNPERQLFSNTVLEEVMYSLRQTGVGEEQAEAQARALLGQFSLAEKAGVYPLKLSGGQKQRLALLAVLALRPDYYILDEPLTGIDRTDRQGLIELLAKIKLSGCGMCVITHDCDLLDGLADRYIAMEKGRVQSDEKT